jgi:hypothetical protein
MSHYILFSTLVPLVMVCDFLSRTLLKYRLKFSIIA